MKNLESLAGSVMGADLAEVEMGLIEKTEEVGRKESQMETNIGQLNGKVENDFSQKDLPDSNKTSEKENTENNSDKVPGESEEDLNDEEDKASFVSLSQSTDFEISPKDPSCSD